MNSKYFVPFNIAQQLKEKGYPQEDMDTCYDAYGNFSFPMACVSYFARPITNAPIYHEVLDWLDMEGYIVTVEYDSSHNGSICSFRSIVYDACEKLYTSEWATTREFALNDGITKVLEDYL